MTEQKYPTPKERERLLKQRRHMLKLAVTAALTEGTPDCPSLKAARRVLADHPPADAVVVMRALEEMIDCARLEHLYGFENQSYQNYVTAFRRFGGKRTFLRLLEFAELKRDESALSSKLARAIRQTANEQRRLKLLHDLLLTDAVLWQDITPEDPPANPDPLPKPRIG